MIGRLSRISTLSRKPLPLYPLPASGALGALKGLSASGLDRPVIVRLFTGQDEAEQPSIVGLHSFAPAASVVLICKAAA